MGADVALDSRIAPAERRQTVLDATHGEGADVGDRSGRRGRGDSEGLDLARVGGRYVIAGHYTDVGDSTINAHQQINRKHLEIRGCWGSEARHFLRALSMLERIPSIPFRASARALRPGQSERGARRRRSHADSEGARRSVRMTRCAHEDRRHARSASSAPASSTRSIAAASTSSG
jgi:hypothetical protein